MPDSTYTLDDMQADIAALVAYLSDEFADYLECLNPDNENSAEGHIYEAIQRLQIALGDTNAKQVYRIEGIEGYAVIGDPNYGDPSFTYRLFDARQQVYTELAYGSLGEACIAAANLVAAGR